MGKRYTEIFPVSKTNGVFDNLIQTYTTGHRHQDEIHHTTRNVTAWLHEVYVRLHDYVILSAEDITLNKNKDKLLAENSRLRSVDEARTQFFNNASHEFRTPITLILGPLQDIINNNSTRLPSEDLHKLEMVLRNVARLRKLVNSMLDFSRIEAGKLDAIFQPTDISALTNDLAINFREIIERAGIKFVCKFDKSMPIVYVNRSMWEKIVLNLLSNAFKFTQKRKDRDQS